MQESKEQISIYNLLQKFVYVLVILDFFILFCQKFDNRIVREFAIKFSKMEMFYPAVNMKISTIVLIILVAIGTSARKELDVNINKTIVAPTLIGLSLVFGSLFIIPIARNPHLKNIVYELFNIYEIIYLIVSFLGAFLLMVGLDNISKIIKFKLGKDKWNFEEESFDQNKRRKEGEEIINIPYKFYYKNKMHNGWLNINPFRGNIVIGTPGSGKSFGIINPMIRQMVNKGFTMCLYDFKFPDLAQIAYFHYLQKKRRDKNYKHKFAVVNVNDVQKSVRVNPLKAEFIVTQSDAQEMADCMVNALQKGQGGSGGSGAFFTQSAINFLASAIYYFANYEKGKYSDLPHILAFMNRSYEEVFDVLFSNIELHSLLSTFESSYKNGAFDQLEGQVGTLKIFLSKLHTKETAWVLSGDDIKLNISSKENPTIMVLASDPRTQDQNSAIYSTILNKTIQLINTKKNIKTAIIADEFPTIYIHKIDNLIATARSNKVAVLLGLQELPQLKQFYKKEIADTIMVIVGNIFSGSARDKYTLDWLEKILGKVKQKSKSISINKNQTNVNINEKMDFLIPAHKIASLNTGEMVGLIAKDVGGELQARTEDDYIPSVFNGKINLDMKEIKIEEDNYSELPNFYSFYEDGVDKKKEVLLANYLKINKDIENVVKNVQKEVKECSGSL